MKKIVVNSGILSFGALVSGTISTNADVLKIDNVDVVIGL